MTLMGSCILCENRGCLGVYLWLLFKGLFTQKSVQIIFFYFLKIIFEISASKWFENIKNILLQSKKKNFNFFKNIFEKHSHTGSKNSCSTSWCFLLWYIGWILETSSKTCFLNPCPCTMFIYIYIYIYI